MRIKLLFAFMLSAIAAFGQQNPIQIDANGLTQTFGAGGIVTRGQIVKINSAGQVVPVLTTDTSGAIGIAATSQQNVGQSITISLQGSPLVQIDASGCAAGNIVSISTSTGGAGHCAATASGQQIGVALSASSPGSLFWYVQLSFGGGSVGILVVNPLASGAKFDVHIVKDASTTLNSATISCPNNDCNFATLGKAVIGQVIYCSTALINGTVLNIGTIATISAQSITSTGLSASTQTGTAICAWGDDDTNGSDPLNSSWNATSAVAGQTNGPVVYQMPSGITMTHKCLWNTDLYPNNTALDGYAAPTIQGAAGGGTKIVVLPLISQGGTFDLTTCPAGNSNFPPMFGPAGSASCTDGSANYRDFIIDGLGNGLAGINMGQRSVIGSGNVAQPCGLTFLSRITCVGFGGNATNLYGIRTGGIGSTYTDFNVDGCGNNGVQVVQPGNGSFQAPIITFRTAFVGDTHDTSVTVNNNVILNSFGSTYGPSSNGPAQIVVTGANATFNSYGEGNIFGSTLAALECNTNATCNVYGSKFQQTLGWGCHIITGATLTARDTTCIGGSAPSILVDSTSKYIDVANNKNTFPNSISGTLVADSHSVKGVCTGVASASLTLGLYGTGPNATTTTCNSTTIGTGIPVSGARTLGNLLCTSSANGTATAACTVVVNGSATAITCSLNGVSSCIDGTHTVALVDGDRVSLELITGATETAANVKMIVEWN